MEEQLKAINVLLGNKRILKMRLRKPKGKGRITGEVDIMIDAAKRTFFDKVCLQQADGKVFAKEPTNAVSWHGYYVNFEDGTVQLPVIHFKNETYKPAKKINKIRHTGAIHKDDVFLFPVCSLYVPSDMNTSRLPELQSNDPCYDLSLRENTNARIDFFVLPKGVPIDKFMKETSMGSFYFLADISIFNRELRGEFLPLPVDDMNNIRFLGTTIDQWGVFIRVLYRDETREPELCGTYSLLFHDPNGAIDMLLNRTFGFKSENDEKVTFEILRDIHRNDTKTIR